MQPKYRTSREQQHIALPLVTRIEAVGGAIRRSPERSSHIRAHQINLQRSLIGSEYRLIRGRGQPSWVCGRDNRHSEPPCSHPKRGTSHFAQDVSLQGFRSRLKLFARPPSTSRRWRKMRFKTSGETRTARGCRIAIIGSGGTVLPANYSHADTRRAYESVLAAPERMAALRGYPNGSQLWRLSIFRTGSAMGARTKASFAG